MKIKSVKRNETSKKGTLQPKKSKRLGRDFEMLIAMIQKLLVPRGAIIKSPDYLPDIYTSSKREVDASIRYTIGEEEVIIAVECRDRNKRQDVTWLEQLYGKKQSLGISKVICVSAEGFTADAIKKGEQFGIQLRRTNNISELDILSLLTLQVEMDGYRTINCTFKFFDKDEASKFPQYLENVFKENYPLGVPYLKIIHSDKFDDVITSMEIFDSFLKKVREDGCFENVIVPENGESEIATLLMSLEEHKLYFFINGNKLYIESMEVEFVLNDKRLVLKTSSKTEYLDVSTNRNLVDVHNFVSEDPTSFYKFFAYSVNKETNESLLIAKNKSDEEVNITGKS